MDRRTGPRPIGPQLSTAQALLTSSLGALPLARSGSLPWHPSLRAEASALEAALAASPPGQVEAALGRLTEGRWRDYLAGLAAYQQHPWRRDVRDPPPVAVEGGTHLRRYGAGGPPVLFVPSLVNRGYILDLSARRSLLRWLAAAGLDPWLVDWGAPGPAEQHYGLAEYVGRLGRLVDQVARTTGGPIGLVGYCMGGNLALAAALETPARVAALALLATPWDFHADMPPAMRTFGLARQATGAALGAATELPVDLLQLMFLALDPALGLRKFTAFARLDPASDAAHDFVALEDWLNDGVPLAHRTATDCLVGWYGDNAPARGAWRVGNAAVAPGKWQGPVLIMVPTADRIVPPAAAVALATAMPRADVLQPPLGHIGMIVSARAETQVWTPLRDWLLASFAAVHKMGV